MYMYTTLMEYFSDFLSISQLSFRFVSDINSQINAVGARCVETTRLLYSINYLLNKQKLFLEGKSTNF